MISSESLGAIGRFNATFVEEFLHLYKGRRRCFENALIRVYQDLEALLTDPDIISTSQQRRIRLEHGRVKGAERLLAKAVLPRYETRINSPEDIFREITDICGTRITCNTKSDIQKVVGLILASTTLSVPSRIDPEKCYEDFIDSPKESGYRAVHLLVGIHVPIGSGLTEIICEIQVRTLLQNAWGELTHEDTFKPEVQVPDLVSKLSKRLATTFAVLDEISQDLRDELEKLSTLPTATKTPSEFRHPGDVETPLTRGEILQAFSASFGRIATLNSSDILLIQQEFAKSAIDIGELYTLLEKVRLALREVIEASVPLADRDLILLALDARGTPDNLHRALDQALSVGIETIDRAIRFEAEYSPGKTFLGTILRVERKFLLLRLTTGDTAISGGLSLTGKWVDARTRFKVGQTIAVRLVHVDPLTNRIEAQVIDEQNS